MRSGLGGQLQARRGIVAGHVHLDQLDSTLAENLRLLCVDTHSKFVRHVEVLVSEQLVEFVTGLDTVALVVVLGSENFGNVDKFPRLDVVVTCVPSVDVSLDSVTIVANNKAGDGQFMRWELWADWDAYTIGFSLFLRIVLSSCTVS